MLPETQYCRFIYLLTYLLNFLVESNVRKKKKKRVESVHGLSQDCHNPSTWKAMGGGSLVQDQAWATQSCSRTVLA